mmetsp:Transcript_13287/g.28397  ORF Transcript_13287/g.28397 Transcript_13287/m.28397 type:complete len:209 (+) Transcript_13287:522-1148(+)
MVLALLSGELLCADAGRTSVAERPLVPVLPGDDPGQGLLLRSGQRHQLRPGRDRVQGCGGGERAAAGELLRGPLGGHGGGALHRPAGPPLLRAGPVGHPDTGVLVHGRKLQLPGGRELGQRVGAGGHLAHHARHVHLRHVLPQVDPVHHGAAALPHAHRHLLQGDHAGRRGDGPGVLHAAGPVAPLRGPGRPGYGPGLPRRRGVDERG